MDETWINALIRRREYSSVSNSGRSIRIWSHISSDSDWSACPREQFWVSFRPCPLSIRTSTVHICSIGVICLLLSTTLGPSLFDAGLELLAIQVSLSWGSFWGGLPSNERNHLIRWTLHQQHRIWCCKSVRVVYQPWKWRSSMFDWPTLDLAKGISGCLCILRTNQNIIMKFQIFKRTRCLAMTCMLHRLCYVTLWIVNSQVTTFAFRSDRRYGCIVELTVLSVQADLICVCCSGWSMLMWIFLGMADWGELICLKCRDSSSYQWHHSPKNCAFSKKLIHGLQLYYRSHVTITLSSNNSEWRKLKVNLQWSVEQTLLHMP
jgi:hypothetical protein